MKGMKHLPLVILLATLALVAVVTGCRGEVRYDARLTAADSLLATAPDSALALVEALDSAALATPGDRAYRDLLLTQARYKCYITATTDSAINRALAYYRAHGDEREKLTRAYIYKGAVMEELGLPDSAMLYYKHAEATAAPDDYINLGQINTRIADLYRKYFGDKEICFKKFEKALKYHRLSGNIRQQQNCYFNMAGCVGITGQEEPSKYFDKSLELALELEDTFLIVQSKELLARQLLNDETTRFEGKRIALECLHNYRYYVNIDLLLDLAYSYAIEGVKDSAVHYLNIIDNTPIDQNIGQILHRSYSIHAIIAKNENDLKSYDFYTNKSKHISDSLTNNKLRYNIQHIENDKNENQLNSAKHENSLLQRTIIIVAIVFSVVSLVLLIIHFRKRRQVKAIIQELENVSIDKHETFLKQLEEKNNVIEQLVKNMVTFMQTSIEASETTSPKVIRERIKNTITDVADEGFWEELKKYLDKKYDGLITRLGCNPAISDKDLKFIELSCCGFSYVEIAITLNYSPKYVSQKRKVIAKKLNLSGNLQEYLKDIIGKKNI